MLPEREVQIVNTRCIKCGEIVGQAEMLVGYDGRPLYRKVEPLDNISTTSPYCPVRGKGLPHITVRTQNSGK